MRLEVAWGLREEGLSENPETAVVWEVQYQELGGAGEGAGVDRSLGGTTGSSLGDGGKRYCQITRRYR